MNAEAVVGEPPGDGGAALVVLFGPSGPHGGQICELLTGWARAELIRPCYWLTPQDVGAGVVKALRLDADGAAVVQLPADLGSERWVSSCLALIQLVAPEISHDPSEAAFAERYMTFLVRQVLSDSTAKLRINVVVPTSDAVDATRDLLVAGWDQTVIVSPEERATPEHANVLVLLDQNLCAHAAASAASAAGLWTGMDGTPLRGLILASGSGEASPRMMRSFVRAVRGGEVDSLVARAALTPSDSGWRVPQDEGRPMAPAADPRYLINEAVRQIEAIDHGALIFGPSGIEAEVVKKIAGWRAIWETFKEYCSIVVQWMISIPGRILAVLSKWMTKMFFGAKGGHEFSFKADEADNAKPGVVELRERMAEAPDSSVAAEARAAEKALALLGRDHRPEPARAQTWVELRQLCLGMMDGGPLPSGLDAPPVGAAREVITDPDALVPDSSLPRWSMPEVVCHAHELLAQYMALDLPPCDPVKTDRLDRDLLLVRAELEERRVIEAVYADGKEIEADTLLRQAAAAHEADEDGSLFLQKAKVATAEAEQARVKESQQQVWVERLTGAIDGLEAWARARSETLLWRVGEGLGDQLEKASAAHRAAKAGMETKPEMDSESVARARRAVTRQLVVMLVVVIALVVAVRRYLEFDDAPLIGAVLFLVGGLISFTGYSRVKSEADWTYENARAQQRNSTNEFVHTAREVSRLSATYDPFVAWAEILGFEAHQPWLDGEAAVDRAAVVEIDLTTLPPAMVIGSSVIDDESLESLAATAARDLQGEGWLSEMYQQSKTFAMARQAHREGRPVHGLDPETDSSMAPTGARRALLSDLQAGLPQQAAFNAASADISAFCAGLEPDRLFKQVSLADGKTVDVKTFLSALVRDPRWPAPPFLVDLLTDAAAVDGVAEDVRTYVWAPAGIGATGKVTSVKVPTTASGEYLLSTVRIDLSRELDPADLRLFAAEPAVAPAAVPASVDVSTGDDGAW